MNSSEYEANYKIQKMFTSQRIAVDTPLRDVRFFHTSGIIPLQKESFFFWAGKWRNTNPDSKWGSQIFDENEIRPIIYWS